MNTVESLREQYRQLQTLGSQSVAAAVSESTRVWAATQGGKQSVGQPVAAQPIGATTCMQEGLSLTPSAVVDETDSFLTLLYELAKPAKIEPVTNFSKPAKHVGFGSSKSRFGSAGA